MNAIGPAPRSAVDVGANTGVFSRVAAEAVPFVISADIDPAAVEKNLASCSV